MKAAFCCFVTVIAGCLHAATLEVYHDLAAFAARAGTLNQITFDDLPTGGEAYFTPDHYQPSTGMRLTALNAGGQYAGDSFGFPVDFAPVSAPNVYSPGPVGVASSSCITRVDFYTSSNRALSSAFGYWYIDSDVSQYPCHMKVYNDALCLWQEITLPVGGNGSQQFIGVVCATEGGGLQAGIGRVDIDSGRGWPASSHEEGVVLDDFYCTPPSGSPAIQSALVSRFETDNEGWWLWDAPTSSGVLPYPGTSGINTEPLVDSGDLLVGDLGYDWLYAMAPDSWHGDWRSYHMVNARVTPGTAEPVSIASGYYMADGYGTDAQNAAILVMDEFMTAGVSSHMTVNLQDSQWSMLRGNWQDLLASVQVFGVRLDLNSLVTPEETHLLHEIVVGPLPELHIEYNDPQVRVFWQGFPGLNYTLCSTIDIHNWNIEAVLPGAASMEHVRTPAMDERRFWCVEIE